MGHGHLYIFYSFNAETDFKTSESAIYTRLIDLTSNFVGCALNVLKTEDP